MHNRVLNAAKHLSGLLAAQAFPPDPSGQQVHVTDLRRHWVASDLQTSMITTNSRNCLLVASFSLFCMPSMSA